MAEIIDHLKLMERGAGGEVQLTDGMAKLIGKQPFHGVRYDGRRFDFGDKLGFLEAQVASHCSVRIWGMPCADFSRVMSENDGVAWRSSA